MSTIKITAKEVGAELRARDRSVRRAVNRGMREAVHAGRKRMVAETDRRDKVYRGQYKNSWRVVRGRKVGKGLTEWKLINDSPIAGVIERGARPHPVSREGVDAIKEWVARKVLGYRLSGRMRAEMGRNWRRRNKVAIGPRLPRISSGTRQKLAKIDAITWGIVARLARSGQPGTFIVRDNLDDLRAILRTCVSAQIRKQAKERARKVKGPK